MTDRPAGAAEPRPGAAAEQAAGAAEPRPDAAAGQRRGPAARPTPRGAGARVDILARLRAERIEPPRVPRGYAQHPAATANSGTDLLDLLADRLSDYRATVLRTDRSGLPAALAGLLRGVPVVAVPPGLPPELLSAYPGRVLRDDTPRPLSVADLDAPGLAVLTGCAVAVAVTGTLLLDAGPAQGRRLLTLVPDQHICVVHADQVVRGLPEALRRLTDPTRPLTMISGPSATSDIELNRIEGVHGPRQLAVVLVGDD